MEIKKTLDNAPRLVFWRADEAMLVLIPFALGVLFGSLFLMMMGFIGVYLYRRLRKQNGEGNFKAHLYWNLGAGLKKIPSHQRRIRI